MPTQDWRSATTLPRELSLQKVDGKYLLSSFPVKELDALNERPTTIEKFDAVNYDLTKAPGKFSMQLKLKLSGDSLQSFSITFSNDSNQQLVVGYDKASNQYFIDRSHSGKIGFEKGFGKRHTAPRLSKNTNLDITLVIDAASVELFANGGLTVMTDIFFPDQPYTYVQIQSPGHLMIKSLQYSQLKSIW